MWMKGLALISATAAVLAAAVALWAGPADASDWTVSLTGGKGETKSAQAPPTPTRVSDSCGSATAKQITVSWAAVTEATTYTVYESTTGAGGIYSSTAADQTGLSWTSGNLSTNSYWFKVTAYIGTKWISTKSAHTGQLTISPSSPNCS